MRSSSNSARPRNRQASQDRSVEISASMLATLRELQTEIASLFATFGIFRSWYGPSAHPRGNENVVWWGDGAGAGEGRECQWYRRVRQQFGRGGVAAPQIVATSTQDRLTS
jgi:hypothetical protein